MMRIISARTTNIQNESLNYPSGIYFDEIKDVFYIADMHNHRVCLLDRESGIVKALPNQTSNGKVLELPIALTMSDSYGCIVADAGNNDIYHYFDSKKIWVSILDRYKKNHPNNNESFKSLNLPAGVAADMDGNVYINDFLNNRITKIDSRFNISVLVGGSDVGMLDGPCSIAKINRPFGVFCSGRRLYFVDEGNDAVRYVDLDLMEVCTVRVSENSIHKIFKPSALTIDNDGNIFVCEKRRLLCINGKTGQLDLILDSNIWSDIKKDFMLNQRICHIGSVVVPEKGCIYWMDTITGLLYEVKVSF
ncbi:NHL repeat-containing protein [Wukongibacter sp. M2B1]|uniref:NHL repeat-containing protein n=1 Tax=Wukongibacter sp. M2B1 TaxID=3088895 RepID=UPI003D7AB37B